MASKGIDKEQIILMGDVNDSTHKNKPELATQLSALVKTINAKFKDGILSPLTITLGDEFQGIIQSTESGIKTILDFEEERLKQQLDFNLHFVLLKGKIETEINPDIAYGMMGSGLTDARKILTSKKRSRKRFRFEIDKIRYPNLEDLFEVLDGIIGNWKLEDFPLVYDMIQNPNDAEVGKKYQKDRSLIWRRRKTLMIKEYTLLKRFILNYVIE